MPIYETLTSDKLTVVLDIGTAFYQVIILPNLNSLL